MDGPWILIKMNLFKDNNTIYRSPTNNMSSQQ